MVALSEIGVNAREGPTVWGVAAAMYVTQIVTDKSKLFSGFPPPFLWQSFAKIARVGFPHGVCAGADAR